MNQAELLLQKARLKEHLKGLQAWQKQAQADLEHFAAEAILARDQIQKLKVAILETGNLINEIERKEKELTQPDGSA